MLNFSPSLNSISTAIIAFSSQIYSMPLAEASLMRFSRLAVSANVSSIIPLFLSTLLTMIHFSQTKFYHKILLILNVISKLHCCIYFENLLLKKI